MPVLPCGREFLPAQRAYGFPRRCPVLHVRMFMVIGRPAFLRAELLRPAPPFCLKHLPAHRADPDIWPGQVTVAVPLLRIHQNKEPGQFFLIPDFDHGLLLFHISSSYCAGITDRPLKNLKKYPKFSKQTERICMISLLRILDLYHGIFARKPCSFCASAYLGFMLRQKDICPYCVGIAGVLIRGFA